MTGWSRLEKELDRWDAAGEVPTFWWRDDDAEAPTPALDRLVALADRYSVPLHLAVVPANVGTDLSDRLAELTDVFTMQHGFAHVNHEPGGAGASEIGDHRDILLQLGDLREGWQRLNWVRLPNLLSALAPPWNRISDKTVPHLASLGFRLLSTSHPRTSQFPADGLLQVNIHFDPIRWKGGARFRGLDPILDGLCGHLADRRRCIVDRDEPTGMLTHHLQTDEEVWGFVEDLLERLSRRQARWVRLRDLMNAA